MSKLFGEHGGFFLVSLDHTGHNPIPKMDLLSFNSFNTTQRVKNIFQDRCSCPVRSREHKAPYVPWGLYSTVCSLRIIQSVPPPRHGSPACRCIHPTLCGEKDGALNVTVVNTFQGFPVAEAATTPGHALSFAFQKR